MQRLSRELGGLAACAPAVRAWRGGLGGGHQPAAAAASVASAHRPVWAGKCARPLRPFPGGHGYFPGRRSIALAGQRHRSLSSAPGADGPPEDSPSRPAISVVGIPDPLTWLRCKATMYLIDLYFELDVTTAEFERGVKQALVHVSNMMSAGKYMQLKGILSKEMVTYVEKRCRPLSHAQRQQLAVSPDDIIFVLPEDVSVVFDNQGRKFCFIVMRFWLLSSHDGPDDPEGTKIFRVARAEAGGAQRKLATAVYEFHRELTKGASPDWTVTTVWHWHWDLAG